MALSITVHGQGTFTASMEEGPVTFTASIGSVGPQGATGATGPAGVVSATAPITYDSGTQTVGIEDTPTFTSVTAFDSALSTTLNNLGVLFNDNTQQTTAFVGEARKVYITGRNATGSTIAAGKVVYLSGATGNKPTIALAQANAEGTSARVIGITVESIANNADGKVITSGVAENIDTSAFTAGDVVYLSATTAGGMTTTLPTQPYHGVAIGIVTRANASVGSVEVQINNYQELEELSDVSVSDRANNDGLFWESSSSTWRSKTIAEVLGYTPANGTDYLAKADNLSGLASASTARTNLGLGTMAVETASNYLTTSAAATTYYPIPTGTTSQYLRGDGTASTFSTDVISAVPAASTTTAGKVELATEAEAIAGTSTTLAVTPASIASFYQPGWFVPDISGSTGVTSTGTTFVSPTGVNTRLLATASGQYAIRYFGTTGLTVLGFSIGSSSAVANFSRRLKVTGLCFQVSFVANATARVKFGISGNPTAPGDLSVKGVGIRIVGTGAVELQVHNGTTLTNVTSSFTPTSGTPFRFLIDSDGAGNVTLYVDSGSGWSSVATSTAGPTGNSSNYPLCSQEIESTGTFSGATCIFTTQQLAWFLA